jgi:hypothetical protein
LKNFAEENFQTKLNLGMLIEINHFWPFKTKVCLIFVNENIFLYFFYFYFQNKR